MSFFTGRKLVLLSALAGCVLSAALPAGAQEESPDPVATMPSANDVVDVVDKVSNGGPAGEANEWSGPLKLALVFAGLAILPSLLVMTTSFTRIVIVLGFVRRALSTQNIPPNIAIIGLALFLTLFTMAPTLAKVNQAAIAPYLADEIDFQQAAQAAGSTIKEFMVSHTRKSDLAYFLSLTDAGEVESAQDVPLHVAVPAFAISEFRTAFEMGCLLLIPFLLIDVVVSGILLSAGMMMLPPVMISLPLKIILFVMVDGWRLLTQTLVASFF